MICEAIRQLVEYSLKHEMIGEEERIYTTNLLLDLFGLKSYPDDIQELPQMELSEILSVMQDYACEHNLIGGGSITENDLFDTKIMNCCIPRPGEVISKFRQLAVKNIESATAYFYKLNQDSNYIRTDRIKKDQKWSVNTEYGEMDITINLSKPEKDPKAIAAAKNTVQSGYPKCQLCVENIGYAGNITHPARQNLRVIPLDLGGERWGFQYSPYVYYREHCIVFHYEHRPMKIDKNTFIRLFEFVKMFPHYFIGSNADLPIVGGSILTHDHFQGGNFEFAMARAPIEKQYKIKGFEDVEAGRICWPLSVIRLKCKNEKRLVEVGDFLLNRWRTYSDELISLHAETSGNSHNTITPIARIKDGVYELDLALRNNRTSEQYPLGIFHPHEELHHIKRENIGLIEVMGLAVLPARLKEEMELIKRFVLAGVDLRSDDRTAKHINWVESWLPRYPFIGDDNIDDIIQKEIGGVFVKVLECAGVFKRDKNGLEAFDRFMEQC